MFSQDYLYDANGLECKGFVAYDESSNIERPLVLIVHDWTGRNDLAMQRAKDVAMLGYVGFAVDMYGGGKNGADNDEKAALMTPLMEDRTLLARRVNAALMAGVELPQVDKQKVIVIGYCFGGLCALDLARSGADIKGAISFHGLLTPPPVSTSVKVKAKVLVLHGYDDKMVPPEQLTSFATEMSDAQVDWQIHSYGNTQHAFTNPKANDPDFGTVYSDVADKRSWVSAQNFFNEVFV